MNFIFLVQLLATKSSFPMSADVLCKFLGAVIFKVYDYNGNGKVTFNEMLDILRDLTGQFISEPQREVEFPGLLPTSCLNILICPFTFP